MNQRKTFKLKNFNTKSNIQIELNRVYLLIKIKEECNLSLYFS